MNVNVFLRKQTNKLILEQRTVIRQTLWVGHKNSCLEFLTFYNVTCWETQHKQIYRELGLPPKTIIHKFHYEFEGMQTVILNWVLNGFHQQTQQKWNERCKVRWVENSIVGNVATVIERGCVRSRSPQRDVGPSLHVAGRSARDHRPEWRSQEPGRQSLKSMLFPFLKISLYLVLV